MCYVERVQYAESRKLLLVMNGIKHHIERGTLKEVSHGLLGREEKCQLLLEGEVSEPSRVLYLMLDA